MSESGTDDPGRDFREALAEIRSEADADSDLLTPAQVRALDMLVRGLSVPAVARELGVGVRTIFRWKALPPFDRELRRIIAGATSLCLVKLSSQLDMVMGVLLKDVLTAQKGAERAAAASVWLQMAAKLLAAREEAADSERQVIL